MMAELELGGVGRGWAHGRLGNVVLLSFVTSAGDEAMDASFPVLDRAVERHPAGIVVLAMFGERARVPPAVTRARVVRHLARHADHLLAGCTVIEGDTMAALVKRAATKLMTALLKSEFPHRTVRSAAAATDYVAPRAVDDSGARVAQGTLFMAATALRTAAIKELQRAAARW